MARPSNQGLLESRVPSLESHARRALQHSTCARLSALVRLHCDSPSRRWLKGQSITSDGSTPSLWASRKTLHLRQRPGCRQADGLILASPIPPEPDPASVAIPGRIRPLLEASAELGAAITAQMINLTLHEELLAESRASSHCRKTCWCCKPEHRAHNSLAVPLALASLASVEHNLPSPQLPVMRGPVMPVSHLLPWAMRQCGSGRRRADAGALHTACMESAPFYVAAPARCLLWSWELQSSQQYRIIHS